jgi:hypothetical protein
MEGGLCDDWRVKVRQRKGSILFCTTLLYRLFLARGSTSSSQSTTDDSFAREDGVPEGVCERVHANKSVMRQGSGIVQHAREAGATGSVGKGSVLAATVPKVEPVCGSGSCSTKS